MPTKLMLWWMSSVKKKTNFLKNFVMSFALNQFSRSKVKNTILVGPVFVFTYEMNIHKGQ
jgi:hypothetical protein